MDCMPFQMMMRIVVKYSSLFIPFQANHDLTQRGRIGTGPENTIVCQLTLNSTETSISESVSSILSIDFINKVSLKWFFVMANFGGKSRQT